MKLQRLFAVLRGEFANLRPRYLLALVLLGMLPDTVGGRLRAIILRMAGFRIGPGSAFSTTPRLFGEGPLHERLMIGSDCWFNLGCALELGAAITIEDRVTVGPQTLILTTTHSIGDELRRCAAQQSLPVRIGAGAWLGARCTILPGITIGPGAVVAAGAVVHRDVPPHTLVGGVPARVIRTLDVTATSAPDHVRRITSVVRRAEGISHEA